MKPQYTFAFTGLFENLSTLCICKQ